MEAETTGIVISSGAVGAICGVVGTWIKSRMGVKQKRPLDSDDLFVTQQQCQQHRCAIEKRIDDNLEILRKIPAMIEESDRKAEKRSCDLHRRLDPVVEKVAANAAKIEVFENLAKSSSIGGKK